MTNSIMVLAALALLPLTASFQSAGSAGTLTGKVTGPSGAAIPKASLSLLNRVTNYR